MPNLILTTFNCNSIMKHIDIIRGLLKSSDILCLQETLLVEDLSGYLDGIDPRYDFCYTPARTGDHLSAGRPSGGLAIFWPRDLTGHIEPLEFEHDIMGLRLSINERTLLLLNVYLPYERSDTESRDLYQERVSCMVSILDNEMYDDVVVLGDFNAEKSRGGNWNFLDAQLQDFNICQADSVLPSESFTCLSSHSTTSWLDHIFTNNLDIISNVKISYDINSFDHFPLSCMVKNDLPGKTVLNQATPLEFIDWNLFLNANIRQKYKDNLDDILLKFDISKLCCSTKNCRSKVHIDMIDECYPFLVSALKKASQEFRFFRTPQTYIVPGWNTYCKEKYAIARNSFLNWKSQGMPLSGLIFDEMIYNKKVFKAALQYCKDNENNLRKDALLAKFRENDKINFWKEVKKIKGGGRRKPRVIDGRQSDSDIVTVFSDKFRAIYSGGCNRVAPSGESQRQNASLFHIDFDHLSETAASLRIGIGPDGIHLNHLKFASYNFYYYLKNLYNFILTHCHTPSEMLLGCIYPLIKDRHGNISDSNNYRPITASVYLFKLFEKCLYPSLKSGIHLTTNQFGFREGTSCQMAGLVLRETVQSYLDRGSRVYSAFLDMTKAYDNVNHDILIEKVSKLDIPPCITNILKDIYGKQSVVVKYGEAESCRWGLSRGVRQGSVLSPLLFNLYINDLLLSILGSGQGCSLGSARMGIIGYADDLVLLSPAPSGLQDLMDQLVCHLNQLGLALNPTKSMAMIFSRKRKNLLTLFKFFLNNIAIKNVKEVKYLGFIITANLSIVPDINRCKKNFNKQFFSFFMNFKFAHFSTLKFLFKSFCYSFYGSELWCDRRGAVGALKSLAVAYHGGIKRILKVGKRSSSHWACNFLNMPTFIHLANKRLFKFFCNMFHNNSPCTYHIINRLRYSSFAKYTYATARETYQIVDLLDNDFQAVCSRIEYVQCGEHIYGIDYF